MTVLTAPDSVFDQRRTALDRHDFGHGPQWQSEVDRQRILHMDHDVGLDDRLESDLGHLNAIGTGRKIRNEIDSFTVRLRRVLNAVVSLTIKISAAATTPPDGSKTIPLIVPVGDCAEQIVARAKPRISKQR